ncbi:MULTISPECIES: AMP-binding protein [Ignavibacterium]|jgi:long-chain acyl-CoA synthetase|uniref:AMP-binding protein n=2 Tax=Ignavibacteriaceae TaxID=795749 RepID=UPI0025BC2175|nr:MULTISPECIES: AMP-binding protein [Ignavibacterium]MBI5660791.1 AMP-binding protein [Ignavibacterium album]
MFLKDYNKTAMILKDQKISYAQLLNNIACFSNYLEGDLKKLAIFCENRFEWVYAFYASWSKNAIVVPIDFMSSAEDISFILNDCKPEVIVYSNQTSEICDKVCSDLSFNIKRINVDEIRIDDKNDKILFPSPDKDKTAVIIYTSGTTGSPKGVMLSFDNLLVNIEAVTEDVVVYEPNDRVLVLLPLHHIFPLIGTVVSPLKIGATIIFSPTMAAEDLMETLQKNQITMIISVPRFYSIIRKSIKEKIEKNKIAKLLFRLAEKKDSLSFSRKIFKSVHKKFGSNIKYMVSGGAALDKEVAKDLRTLGFEVLEGYGMTECAPMITFTKPGKVVIGSAGQPLKTNEVKIVEGEILNRGRNVMQGYYNRPDETDAIIKNGWLYTGDLGYLDDENRLFITGRKKEIIILSNGKNINPEEIENKLTSMSDVINEVGVYEKADMLYAVMYCDEVKVKQSGIENLEEFLRWNVIDKYNQSVTPYKKVMKFLIVNEPLPRTRLSKLKRFLLPQLEVKDNSRQDKIPEPVFQEYTVIKEFIQQQKELTVHAYDHLEIDLGLDSLDKVNLEVFLEQTFGVKMNEKEILSFPNILKLAESIKEHKTKLAVEVIDWGKILQEELDIKLPQSWFTHNLMKHAAKIFLNLYFRLKSEGLENIPEGPFILAPNHQSFLDGLFVAVFLKNKMLKKTYFYAKEKHVQNRILKFIADKSNVIVMDLSDLKSSLQKLAEVLRNGRNLIIFPEGTRSFTGELGDFKKTFAILSRELNIPVVPVAIDGAVKALPRGTIIPRPFKKVRVKFLKPIMPSGHSYESLRDAVFEKVSAHLNLIKPDSDYSK